MPMESGAVVVVVPPAAAGWVVVAIMVSNVDGALITETPQGQQRTSPSELIALLANSCTVLLCIQEQEAPHKHTVHFAPNWLPTFLSPVSRRRSWWWDDVYLSLKINRIVWENVLNWRWGGTITIRFLCDERRSSCTHPERCYIKWGKERMPWKTKERVNDVVGRETRGAFILLMTGKDGGGPFYYSMGDWWWWGRGCTWGDILGASCDCIIIKNISH